MVVYNKGAPQTTLHPQAASKGGGMMRWLFPAVGAVVFIGIIYYLFFSGTPGVINVNGRTSINVTGSVTLFTIEQGQYLIYLKSANQTTGRANVYVGALPVFLNPLLNVSLTLGNKTRVNAGTTFANMEIRLTAIGAKSVSVDIAPIDPTLQIAPDLQRIRPVQSGIGATQATSGTGGQTSTAATTTAGSTTIAPAGSTVTTTSVAATNATYVNIVAAWKRSQFYPLMANYTTIYANTTNCTVAKYNTAYTKVYGSAPAGPNTYQNVSRFVPYNLYTNITGGAGGNYSVLYRTKTTDSLYNNKVALNITVNASRQSILNTTLTGIYKGLSYTILKNSYTRATSTIGGACGIDVP